MTLHTITHVVGMSQNREPPKDSWPLRQIFQEPSIWESQSEKTADAAKAMVFSRSKSSASWAKGHFFRLNGHKRQCIFGYIFG